MLVAGAAIYGVSGSDVFGFERLEIAPVRYTDEADLASILAIEPGTNLFEVRTEPLAERLRQLPTVLDARVEVSLPDTLIVHVTEREPILIWLIGDAGHLVDPNGRLFALAEDAPGDAAAELPSIVDDRAASTLGLATGSTLDPIDFEAARRIVALTPADVGSVAQAFGVTVTDANGFVLSTRPGSWVAVFGFYTPTLRTPELVPGQVRLLRSLLAEREAEIARIILASDEDGTYIPIPTPKP